MPPNPLLRRLAPLAAACLLTCLAGCQSARYQLSAPGKAGLPPSLHLGGEADGWAATVESVIVIHGPGAWKRNAYWDEYVLTLQNLGPTELTLEAAHLEGRRGNLVPCGHDPWALERASRSAAERNYELGRDVVVQLGAGTTVVAGSAVGVAATAALLGVDGWAALGAGMTAGVVAAPAFIGGSIYRNVSGRHEVEREFARRDLALPRVLAPGQRVQASLFFPITPGPQRLRLAAQAAGRPVELQVDLAALGQLHLQAPASARPA
ncbi:MAG: hypothetical protein ACHQ5A_15340, partial [Opitutales bacterium]